MMEIANVGAGVLLRCPAETAPDEAGLFLADRCHSLPFALSATGGAWVAPPRRPAKAFPRGEGGFKIANTLAILKTDEECGRKSFKFVPAARPAKRGVEGTAPYSGLS